MKTKLTEEGRDSMSDGHAGVEYTWELTDRGLSDGARCKMEDMNDCGGEMEKVI